MWKIQAFRLVQHTNAYYMVITEATWTSWINAKTGVAENGDENIMALQTKVRQRL